ncbi:hypothetical protein D3C78_1543640 [compost metagenome]
MCFAGEALIVFSAPEVRQNILIRPPIATQLTPMIVIFRTAPHVHHRVDRTATTKDSPLDHFRRDPTLMDLGLQRIATQQLSLGGLEVGHGHVNVRVPVPRPLLEEGHSDTGILAKPGGCPASSRTAAYNDIVNHLALLHVHCMT